LRYQNRLTGNAPQAQAVDVTKSSVREADGTQGINTKSTRATSSKQTLPKQQSCASNTWWRMKTDEEDEKLLELEELAGKIINHHTLFERAWMNAIMGERHQKRESGARPAAYRSWWEGPWREMKQCTVGLGCACKQQVQAPLSSNKWTPLSVEVRQNSR
jgi:hypothetical protein